MTPLLNIWIEGLPITKGSMKLIPPKFPGVNAATGKPYRPRQVADDARLKTWQALIKFHVEIAMRRVGVGAISAPVVLRLLFVLDRLIARRRTGDVLSKHVYPELKPDLDKLQRAAFDAMNKVAYSDDGRVVGVTTAKIYAGHSPHFPRPGLKLALSYAADDYWHDACGDYVLTGLAGHV